MKFSLNKIKVPQYLYQISARYRNKYHHEKNLSNKYEIISETGKSQFFSAFKKRDDTLE